MRATAFSGFLVAALEDDRQEALPGRVGLETLPVEVLHLVELATAADKVDLTQGDDLGTLDDLPDEVRENEDRDGDVGGEEVADRPVAIDEDGEAWEVTSVKEAVVDFATHR